jgi:hypothetical protein
VRARASPPRPPARPPARETRISRILIAIAAVVTRNPGHGRFFIAGRTEPPLSFYSRCKLQTCVPPRVHLPAKACRAIVIIADENAPRGENSSRTTISLQG